MRLHLIKLLDLQSSPTVLPLSLSHHVETGRAHRNILESDRCRLITSMYPICFGGPGENRTPVHNAFATKELQQYRYYTTHLFICQSTTQLLFTS